MSERELLLRVVVPHFFREGAQQEVGGFGSSRHGNRLARGIALSRCLGKCSIAQPGSKRFNSEYC